MDWLIPLAAKSFLVAAAALLLLQLASRRSAADRSAIAHGALIALLLLPLGAWLLPRLEIQTALLGEAELTSLVSRTVPSASEVAPPPPFPQAELAPAALSGFDWSLVAYAVPTILLLLLTVAALVRLWPLKSRAEIIVDPHWLSALAHAQRRMGMKNGTALLVSRELHSPISWGLMRPVILLNDEALDATAEAEAIIAHELAHVSRLDWAKLLLARVATALFWFNPLVWLLAREAHQLREEAADDAVLAADVESTDYAELLVGIARHECRGWLIGAHGVAPGRDSLKRRVRRVLDGTLARTPASRTWFAGFACGAFAAATPLAALTLVPTQMKSPPQTVGRPPDVASVFPVPTTASPVATPAAPASVQSLAAAAAAHPHAPAAEAEAPDGFRGLAHLDEHDIDVDIDVDVDPVIDEDEVDLVALRAAGLSPSYVEAIAQAAPEMRHLNVGTLMALKSSGVTPQLLRDLKANGYGRAPRGDLVAAAVHGVNGPYLSAMRAQGVQATLRQMTEMRVIGVTPDYVARLRKRGVRTPTPAKLIQWRAVGLGPEDVPRHR